MNSSRVNRHLAPLILLAALVPCPPAQAGAEAAPAASVPQLLPLPEPDLAGTDPAVQNALRRGALELAMLLSDPEVSAARLADAFGELALLYHAHLIREPAEVAYRNAVYLAPNDGRWNYYLGYLMQQSGRLADAAAAYQGALRVRPGWATASLRLGGVELELGQFDRALPLLRHAAQDPLLRSAALYQLGRLFLSRKEYAESRQALEAALETSPQSTRLHYPLALTYRALGDLDRAREHLRLRGDAEPAFPDPLIDLLDRMSTGQRMHFHLGMSAAHRRDYATAAAHFEAGLEMDPDNLDARVSLARFLYLQRANTGAAREQLELVLQKDERHPSGNFFLGLMHFEDGASDAAATCFTRVLDGEPRHPGALYFLAEIELRRGAFAQAEKRYARYLETTPENSAARLRRLIAAILQGRSHGELLLLLREAHARHPDNPAFRFFLASLLAASPDDGVRNGQRALELAQGLDADLPSQEHKELLAAAYAETGDFAQAQSLQQQAADLAIAFNEWERLPQLAANLERYEAGEACRVPWQEDALLFSLPPSSVRKAFRDFPTEKPF